MIEGRWLFQLLRDVPEDRWLRRVILRRRTRLEVVGVFSPEAMTYSRRVNAPSSAEVTLKGEDAFAVMQRLGGERNV